MEIKADPKSAAVLSGDTKGPSKIVAGNKSTPTLDMQATVETSVKVEIKGS